MAGSDQPGLTPRDVLAEILMNALRREGILLAGTGAKNVADEILHRPGVLRWIVADLGDRGVTWDGNGPGGEPGRVLAILPNAEDD